eukprot:TRINITY_DN5702_c0_g1_i1.p2 TRINITY_DN5702_c0_g1~~TRINITY_DN5702_c0_g1_i1.p2  ORF type:complete len:127 (-),score=51.97 TRINITY_DN5702_c0_g1_i1:63-413(-)
MSYKQEFSFEHRKQEASRILSVHFPDRIPVIVERMPGKDIPIIHKRKYLIPEDATVGKFVHEIKKNLDIKPEETIFVYVNNTSSPPNSISIAQLYEKYHDEDGFLYISYALENTFG